MVVEYGNYQYKHFKATVSEQQIYVGGAADQRWRYFDSGPKTIPPLICLGAVAATSDVFYKQILTVGSKGYRLLAVDAPAIWSHEKWLTSFDQFLDALNINEVHIYGTALGGFLAQLYAEHRPRRVLSLVLSNTFLETKIFNESYGTWTSLFAYTPDFILKRLVLSGFREGAHEALIADSIDFVVARMDKLSRAELASRLALNCQRRRIGPLPLPPSSITILDSLDYAAVPVQLREAVYSRYPRASQAFLKSGGDFPFLSRPDEVDLHLLLHLRRVGAERVGPDIDVIPERPGGRWVGMRHQNQYLPYEEEEEEEEEGEEVEVEGGGMEVESRRGGNDRGRGAEMSVGGEGEGGGYGKGSRRKSESVMDEGMGVTLPPRANSYPDVFLLGTPGGERMDPGGSVEGGGSVWESGVSGRSMCSVGGEELPVSSMGSGYAFTQLGGGDGGRDGGVGGYPIGLGGGGERGRRGPGIGFWTLDGEESEEGWERMHSNRGISSPGKEEGGGGERG